MSKAAVTRVTVSGGGDPLESVRRAVAFADEMVEQGATVEVTGDLYLSVVFPGEVSERERLLAERERLIAEGADPDTLLPVGGRA
jgi:hypothetical protein